MKKITPEEELRYNRQIILPGFDIKKQEILKNSKVLIVGMGGIGCTAATWLASTGIGKLLLLDFDTVSLCDLHRQILHRNTTVGMLKVNSAVKVLQSLNSDCEINTISKKLGNDSLNDLIKQQHIVLDCTDNLKTREQLNFICYMLKIPLISSAAIRMEGQLSVFTWHPEEPCYHCISRLFGPQKLSCIESGIMAPVVGIMGALQAMETLKVLTNYGKVPNGKIIFYDAFTLQFREIIVKKDLSCETCNSDYC